MGKHGASLRAVPRTRTR